MQNETFAFSKAVDDAVSDIRSVYTLSSETAALAAAQRGNFGEQEALLKSVGDRAAGVAEYAAGLGKVLGGISDAVRKAGIILPDLKTETDAVQRNLSEFISELPTYEE